MDLIVYIRPAISPLDRGELEDRLVEALGDGADPIGGGTMLDGTESDLEIELPDGDADEVLAVARRVLGEIEFTRPTEIEIVIDGVRHALREN